MTSRSYPPHTAAAIDAVCAAVAEGEDAAEWIALVLAEAAGRLGSSEAILARRPGSWEASLVRGLLAGTCGPDDEYLPVREVSQS